MKKHLLYLLFLLCIVTNSFAANLSASGAAVASAAGAVTPQFSGNVTINGNVDATTYTGNGAGLTGVVADAGLSTTNADLRYKPIGFVATDNIGLTTVNADLRYLPLGFIATDNIGLSTANADLRYPSIASSSVVLDCTGVSSSVTGTTNETTLFSMTIPANALGINGTLRITFMCSYPNSSNNKTIKITFGGTTFYTQVFTTTTLAQICTIIHNRGATNSQVSMPLAYTGFGTNTGAKIQGSVDCTSAQTLALTATAATASETIILESILVEAIR